jgi:hypothetical protein
MSSDSRETEYSTRTGYSSATAGTTATAGGSTSWTDTASRPTDGGFDPGATQQMPPPAPPNR